MTDPTQISREAQKQEAQQRFAMVVIVCALLMAFAAQVAFLYIYFTTANTVLLGITTAVAFGGIGIGIIVWAHRLMRHEEAEGPRERISSTPAAREELLADFFAGQKQIERRRVLGRMVAIVVGGLAVVTVSLMRSLIETSPATELSEPIWKRGDRLVTPEGQPVSVDTLNHGATVVVFPEGRPKLMDAQTILIRVQEDLLHLPNRRSGWTPKGNIAYSRVCTHAGCPVALYERKEHLLLCPCHQSTFSVLDGAKATSGPAARALPQLPLYVDDDGFLRAGGDFTEPPGPGFWRLSS